MSVEELCAEAELLSREDQGLLVSKLISQLGRPSYDVSDTEVLQRVKETREGLVADISQEELEAGLKYLPKA